MSTDMKSFDDCRDEFAKIRDGVARIRSLVEGFARGVWDKAGASGVSDALAALDQELHEIARSNDHLEWYFCSNPLHKALTGQQLTREEFYLLAAQRIVVVPSGTGPEQAYEAFAHYLYEDNERRGYINSSNRPDPPPVPTGNGLSTLTTSLKIGIVPEDVRTSFLRAEQKVYFKEYEPELFSRFRKD